jgi:hypothetical protein
MPLHISVDVKDVPFGQKVQAQRHAWVSAGCNRSHGQLNALWVKAQGHWRAHAGGQQAMGLVVKLHGKSHQALQQGRGTLHGLQRITRVDGIDQVRNHLAIAVGAEVVAPAQGVQAWRPFWLE